MKHEYTATVRWKCEGDFAKGQYTRVHDLVFDGGAMVRGSASPLVVPPPYSDVAAIDPEEAFVASVASCHMLWFLDLAKRAGFVVARYTDTATALMEGAPDPWITRVDLYPVIEWDGEPPSPDQLAALHHDAHDRCFVANSIKSEVVVH